MRRFPERCDAIIARCLHAVAAGLLLIGVAQAQAPGPGGPQGPSSGLPAGGNALGGAPPVGPPAEFWPEQLIKPKVSPMKIPDFALSNMLPDAASGMAPLSSKDPRNLDGVWGHREVLQPLIAFTMYGNKRVPYKQSAIDVINERVTADNNRKPMNNASAQCLPPGPDWQKDLNFPFRIVEAPGVIYFVFEEYHGIWVIHLDPKYQRSGKRYMQGDSIGHWEGNTLVVETTHFTNDLWLDVFGTPASTDARLTYHISKIENGQALQIITTIDDPRFYQAPWSMARSYGWHPDKWVLGEYNCEEQLGNDANAEHSTAGTAK